MMSAGSPIDAVRHAKIFLHTAHRYRDVAPDIGESRTAKCESIARVVTASSA
jgi:hypothetical protein